MAFASDSNESWDHESHRLLSYLYLWAACLAPSALFFALLPEIRSRYPGHWIRVAKSRAAQLLFHAMWISPLLGYVYLQGYEHLDKPSWELGVLEHCMTVLQLVSCGVVLTTVIQEGEKDPNDVGVRLLAELQRQSDTP